MRIIVLFLLTGIAMAQAPAYQEVATTAQLMQGLVEVSRNAITEAAKDSGPADDRAWRAAQVRGVMLQEAAQLLMSGTRVKDQDGWMKASKAFGDAGAAVAKAAGEKDLAAFQAAAAGVGGTCMGCHSVYRVRGGGRKGADAVKK